VVNGLAVSLADAWRHDDGSPAIIAPSHGWPTLRLKELWDCRELLYFLVPCDFDVEELL
jgi:hypothetical protein